MPVRRANSSGSISKLKDTKRRKPWRVRVTQGWEFNEEAGRSKQLIKVIGDFATRAEAEAAYNYSSSLYNMKMRDIRLYHLQECMEKAFIIPTTGKEKGKKRLASAGSKARMKSMFNLMFDYAYAREIVDRNYARAFEISKEIRKQQAKDKRENVPFSDEEIQVLWGMVGKIKFADMILIAIYSGWRPQELSILKVKDIDLEEDIMTGGMKTEAGTDRVVNVINLNLQIYP